MKTLQEQFESLPHIKEKLAILRFNMRDSLYEANNILNTEQVADMHWVNGAWYAFQEQQKKIDSLRDLAESQIKRFKSDKNKDEVTKGIVIAYNSLIYHLDNIGDFLK